MDVVLVLPRTPYILQPVFNAFYSFLKKESIKKIAVFPYSEYTKKYINIIRSKPNFKIDLFDNYSNSIINDINTIRTKEYPLCLLNAMGDIENLKITLKKNGFIDKQIISLNNLFDFFIKDISDFNQTIILRNLKWLKYYFFNEQRDKK